MHNESSTRPTALSVTCIRLLGSKEYLLTHRVLNSVSVTRLPVHKHYREKKIQLYLYVFAQSIIVFLIWIVSKSKRLVFDLNERAPQAKYSLPPEKNSRILDLKLKPELKLKICRKLNYNPTLETEGFYSNSAVTLNQSSNCYEYKM